MTLDLFVFAVWALYIAGCSVLLFFSTWLFFVAIMNLKRVRDAGKLTPASHALGVLIEAIGYVLDLALNWLIAPLVFLEVRWGEWLLSARITRLVSLDPNGWRCCCAPSCWTTSTRRGFTAADAPFHTPDATKGPHHA